jgi:alcohol dehydrogenase (cytochrome c)
MDVSGTTLAGWLFCIAAAAAVWPSHSAWAADWTIPPKHEWPTFGGDYSNTRFSRLDQITRGNVDQLEVKWSFSTKLGPDPVYAFATVPIVSNGVMYVTDPGNFQSTVQNVFAVDARSGAELWHATLPLIAAPEKLGQFNIRANRGVGIGNHRIYVATQDARLWALDAQTGALVEGFGTQGHVAVADVFAGYYLSAPPIFVPRSKVPPGGPASGRDLLLIGIAGAENETRGFFSAYDANTGELIWRFFTVPGPNEPGGDTWPAITDGPWTDPFERGGASPWMPPAYDARLGFVIFGTGNAGPDYDGTHREGANLFAASIVALDVRDGRRVWHFQEVHHDLWDYDQAAPPVLFDVKRKGKAIPAVGAAGKTGWFYILDRRTGEPLIPCPERPVPTQTAVVAPDGTPERPFPTQPFCESDAFVPQGDRTLPSGQYVHPIFTPPGLPAPGATGPYLFPSFGAFLPIVPVTDQLLEPSNGGGSDWTPSSYNPELGLAYIGGNVLPTRMTAMPTATTTGTGNLGGWWSWTAEDQVKGGGTLTAMDVATGRIRWQVKMEGQPWGGTCATAGGLVFVGETDDDPAHPFLPLSYFSAYDAATGERLWRYRVPNDVPVAAPCVSFSVGDDQYIAVAAGGTFLWHSKGDRIYVFGLRGRR